jgi:hypothetical protein
MVEKGYIAAPGGARSKCRNSPLLQGSKPFPGAVRIKKKKGLTFI